MILGKNLGACLKTYRYVKSKMVMGDWKGYGIGVLKGAAREMLLGY